mgnify:CR=1 FL=1
MRGEDGGILMLHHMVLGSPPHARGRQKKVTAKVRRNRITPACAGKTATGTVRIPTVADHPRMRGEDARVGKTSRRHIGSPPHARGRQRSGDPGERAGGITPACAGKTSSSPFLTTCPWDHPRMRGEDYSVAPRISKLHGSPPHARGRLREEYAKLEKRGITPACAGKTTKGRMNKMREGDHPRMRGEDVSYYNAEAFTMGSPPHARGRRERSCRYGNVFGITPACAGKTSSRSPTAPSSPDHPRMRGEDTPVKIHFVSFSWITPACAGKT